jgi:YD repeat-containing protein
VWFDLGLASGLADTNKNKPSSASLQYVYDQGQRMISVTNVRGETRTFAYDNDNNPLSLVTANAGGTTTQSHTATCDDWGSLLQSIGAASQVWSMAYDKMSNLTSITDPAVGGTSAVRSNAYDAQRPGHPDPLSLRRCGLHHPHPR